MRKQLRDTKPSVLFTLLIIALMTTAINAAELIMLEAEGCVFCKKFDAEIGPVYPKTKEGKLAPLRRINIADPWPADLAGVKDGELTPTFILVNEGKEVDRLVGYPGDEHFWFLLGELLAKLPTKN